MYGLTIWLTISLILYGAARLILKIKKGLIFDIVVWSIIFISGVFILTNYQKEQMESVPGKYKAASENVMKKSVFGSEPYYPKSDYKVIRADTNAVMNK